MNRITIINHFIKKNDYKSYLEIGCQNNTTFNNINIIHKVGVDPEKGGTNKCTSDEYFAIHKDKFDIIFIDGLHHSEQVDKDVINSLACLNEGGTIIMHDLLPEDEKMQIIPRETKAWTGDVWKSWVKLRQNRDDLNMFVINTDMGCGVITRGKQKKLINKLELNYNNFAKNKEKWMNIISPEDFLNK